MSDKQALLSALTAQYEELFSSIMGLQDGHMTLPMLGDWSATDILAHIACWQREIAGMFERMTAGQPPAPDGVDYSDVDGWNARFVEETRELSPAEVLTALHAGQATCVRAVEAMPEERLAEGRTAGRLLRGALISHYGEHAAQIWAWRDALKDEALARYGEVLRPRDAAGRPAAGEG